MKRFAVVILVILLTAGCLSITAWAAEPEVQAKAAVLMDAATGTVLYEYKAHTALPPASVTKVMTMLLIMEAIENGQITWDDPVVASATAAGKGGSQIYLKEGEEMSVAVLLKAVAVSSACSDAPLLSEADTGFR